MPRQWRIETATGHPDDKMISGLLKFAAFMATTAVAIPYTSALLCNVAFGWPQVKNRFRRALNPRKVYALNFCIIQDIILRLRYARLYLQWNTFYKMATATQIMKDRPYGRNDQTLDLYFPQGHEIGDGQRLPVVVFMYGGAWGSGSKSMYGMMCNIIAKKLGVIVCCPNHSTYPQGYVDDMVQDIVDCLSWVYMNVEHYGGDRKKTVLIGHSSGAHLSAMALLELLHDEVVSRSLADYQPVTSGSIQFSDQHFDGSTDGDQNNGCQSSGSSGSFIVVDKGDSGDQSNGQGAESVNLASSQFEHLQAQNSGQDSQSASLAASQFEEIQSQRSVSSDGSMIDSDIEIVKESEGLRYRGQESEPAAAPGPATRGRVVGQGSAGTESVDEEDSGDNDSVVTVKNQTDPELAEFLTDSHPSLRDLSKCLRAFIGLAGVYHIGDHFKHESERGVEDISTMTRSMYGVEHFDRFSPTHILSTLNGPISFPMVMLIHGTDDYVVPVSSTTKFSEQLQRIGVDVTTRFIPSCDHYAICMDLMREDRKFHSSVLNLISNVVEKVLR